MLVLVLILIAFVAVLAFTTPEGHKFLLAGMWAVMALSAVGGILYEIIR